MKQKEAHFFPAFVLKYTGKEIKVLENNSIELHPYLNKASEILDVDLRKFDIVNNDYLSDELKNQYYTYIFSCIFSDILYSKNIKPDYVAGFSMGLYAAMYHAKVVNFESGLLLIKKAYQQVKEILSGSEYAMATVIGFEQEDLIHTLKKWTSIELVIKNGVYSFIITGEKTEIIDSINFLISEGAIHTSILNVSNSYHTKLLKNHKQKFISLVNDFDISDSEIPIVSFVDSKIIKHSDEIKHEVVRNIISKLDFHKTVICLSDNNVKSILECGPGDSLYVSSKFIKGDFDFRSIAKARLKSQ